MDVLISEMLTIICWINPAAWLLRREVRQNLEFLADNSVLESGFDSKNYQYHLLQLSYQTPEIKLGNKFNVAPLKKRITMMNQQKTNKAGILKYSLIVPLALALILSSNAQTIVNSTKKVLSSTKSAVVDNKKETQEPVAVIAQTEQPIEQELTTAIQNTNPTTQQSDDKKIYTVVESMPQFPGGEKALLEYISLHLRYPADAHKNGVQGRIIVRFTVNESGKVENAVILRGVYPSIDAEGLKVASSLPDFIPGEQNGKKVAVYYTLPILFKLDGSSKPAPSSENSSIVVVGYAEQTHGLVAPKVKEFGSSNPPEFIVDGMIQSKGFDTNTIKPVTIKSVEVIKPDTEAKKAELISKYGENAANGVVKITTKI